MKNSEIVLVVDDSRSVLEALSVLLKPHFAKVVTLSNPAGLHASLREQAVDVVLLDMNFRAGINNGNEGLFWLNQILTAAPGVSVVMMTAYGDVELAVKAIRQGAIDFIVKPWDNRKMVETLKAAVRLSRSKNQANRSSQTVAEPIPVGRSASFRRVLDMASRVAATDANVLITGENGTGKEVVAREIHRQSARACRPMVSVDMGAIPEALFESELFGHLKGAFTDAHADRVGKMEAASGSTLFLDEIGNLSLPMQAKLLSVLQNRQVVPVGGNTPIPVELRLVCATNGNLWGMVADGTFREDLLYRINTIHIEVPPLRDRREDVALLAQHFLQQYGKKYGRFGVTLSDAAVEKLERYCWPGNIRELQHAIEKAVILSEGTTITEHDFSLSSPAAPVASFSGTLDEMEQRLIAQAIERNAGNMTAVAAELGITRQTLYNKVKKYGL
ncbi:sigma-54 dependent transcriptional regulator [uncultured Acetobacteroides sp.]|uniref:sigma-54-dependent transcriptional regulator n=1 Tax=uncultured Acetobacteroides sp. TaxID=1760811 RepID=UPI0029F4BC68|nr:sigma-54 dependent transcriptional regulator [uncultured Acetobacteroides sp.]